LFPLKVASRLNVKTLKLRIQKCLSSVLRSKNLKSKLKKKH
jgi:hypothetical protein